MLAAKEACECDESLELNGELHIFHIIKFPLLDQAGFPYAICGIASDITERKASDAELDEYRYRLEGLVYSRTEELEAAKEAADKANRAKSVFLANMSHELRTPLNAILGFARMLEREAGMGDESRRKLAIINRAGQHLLTLINDVLEISRIEAGRSEAKIEPFDLGEMLREIEDMIRLRAEDKGLSFEVDISSALPPCVLGDAHHLMQILINLLGNAVKYTDRGHITLRVKPLNGQIRFEVADTGIGISKDDQEKIFQAFFQTEAGAAKGEGTGLGLAISNEFARLMGGELNVESVPGQGSVFVLSIPLAATDAPVLKSASSHGPVIGLEAEAGHPRILVVDDKADNRELVSQMMEMAGFEVRSAENGLQAIEAFTRWQPQLIWMDIRMPVMDGYEATRKIRALPGGQEVKIVALTASVFEEARVAVLEAGCDEMVGKPVEEDRLFEVMDELLGVRYRYGEKTAPAAISRTGELDLSVLSDELRNELKTTAEQLDLSAVRLIVARIRKEIGEDLATGLTEWVVKYRFDLIVAGCEKSMRRVSHG